MINELDETIKQLLVKKGALESGEVDISFETPNREWSASISKPTVNIYLYDLRENHELRTTEWMIERGANGIATRKKNPSRVDLSYLITVWTNDIEDEHRLLWSVMQTLFCYPDIPVELLSGRLAGQDYPINTKTAQPDGLFNNPADFWTALDNQLKPSVNYVVTLPLDIGMEFTAPIVRTKVFAFKPPDAEAERFVSIAGTVHEAGKPTQGVAKAMVVAKEARMTAQTDAHGNYQFAKLPTGKHTFQVVVPGKMAKEAAVTVPGTNYDLEV